MPTYYQPERSLLTSIYNTIDTTIDNLAMKFRNKTDDLIETMLDITISDLCNNTLKNYTYMQRLMRINAVEHQTTINQLGYNAAPYGNSKETNNTMQMPSYVEDVNYYKNFVKRSDGDTTRVVSSDNRTDYSKGELYKKTTRLFPDDLDALNGNYSNQRWNNLNELGILAKTKKLFQMNKINTIISRFSTSTGGVIGVNDETDIQSKYGMSHGRNLLRKDCETGNSAEKYNIHGYENPYCRVWTHHYQYDRLDKLIRPFVGSSGTFDADTPQQPITKSAFHTWGEFGNTDENGYGWKAGGKSAEGWKYSVLNDNGFVNITPKYDKENKIHTKQCMFSIENLAWKGYSPYAFEKALSWEQRGPLGGRIMWFPPYGIQFNETTQANWTNHTFIGRGEDVYTYTNTVRTGNLSFMMVVDHPSIIDYVSWHGGEGVHDTDLLRFFAGCDYDTVISNAKPTPLTDEQTQGYSNSYYTKAEKAKVEDPVVDEDIPDEVTNITFYVFYPNNYSGVYDTIGSDVEAIAYLLNGANAQKKKGSNDYREDYHLSLSDTNSFTQFNGIGYEMGRGAITNTTNVNTGPIYGSAVRWNTAISKGSSTYTEYNRNGAKREWWYRIDGKYEIPKSGDVNKNTYDQVLLNNSNYEDRTDNALNFSVENVKSLFNDDDDETIYSLAEMVAGLTTDENIKNYLIGLGLDESRVKEISDKFKTSKIVSVKGIGFSNSHGNNASSSTNANRNDILARERVNTAINWFKSCKTEYGTINGEVEIQPIDSESSVKVSTQDVSDTESKKWRSAKITIEITNTSQTKVSEASQVSENENGETIQQGTQKYIGFSTKKDAYGVEYFTDEKTGNAWIEVTDTNDPHYGELMMVDASEAEKYGIGVLYDYKAGNIRSQEKEVKDKNGNTQTTFEGENNTFRYDQEYHFFKTLKQENPIIFDKLMDKIQYFDPAFHSMTPEGFSGRLNFLHQCTRQGNTIGASNKQGTTASNLAFGRPPICVLRLGDFYNQMIVIDSISINFDTPWDLNIEGAGVIPMIANITLSFKFIGGGDLAGPVRRLQNAMSFNYYANGRLYDNRADRVLYKSDGTSIEQGALDNDIDTENSYFYTTEMYKKDENNSIMVK